MIYLDFEGLKKYCLNKKGAFEDFPFDNCTLVFKVGGKMFVLTNIDCKPLYVNLKCDPFLCDVLRQEHTSIKPGYHMAKRHWNTVMLDGSIPDAKIYWMIDMSYELVLKSLRKVDREEIMNGDTSHV